MQRAPTTTPHGIHIEQQNLLQTVERQTLNKSSCLSVANANADSLPNLATR